MTEAATTSTSTEAAREVSAPFTLGNISAPADKFLKILLYGDPGSGKTTLAGSAADVESMGKVLLINAEGGELSLMDNPVVKNLDNIKTVTCNGLHDLTNIYNFLAMQLRCKKNGNIEAAKKNESVVTGVPVDQIDTPIDFRTVIIDSLSELERYNIDAMVGLDNSAQEQLTFDMEPVEVGWPEYKKNSYNINKLLRHFRDLDINVICICSSNQGEDEKGLKKKMPKLTGKLASEAQGYFDIVGYIEVRQEVNPETKENEYVRYLGVQPTKDFQAKNRRSVCGKGVFKNATMKSILKDVGLLTPAEGEDTAA